MEVVNITKGKVLAAEARIADSFFTRLRGLLGTGSLLAGEGLVIRPCNSIHTFGMSYPIDVVFAGSDNRVLKTVTCIGAGRLSMCRGSRYVVELPVGALLRTDTQVGDYLELR